MSIVIALDSSSNNTAVVPSLAVKYVGCFRLLQIVQSLFKKAYYLNNRRILHGIALVLVVCVPYGAVVCAAISNR